MLRLLYVQYLIMAHICTFKNMQGTFMILNFLSGVQTV